MMMSASSSSSLVARVAPLLLFLVAVACSAAAAAADDSNSANPHHRRQNQHQHEHEHERRSLLQTRAGPGTVPANFQPTGTGTYDATGSNREYRYYYEPTLCNSTAPCPLYVYVDGTANAAELYDRDHVFLSEMALRGYFSVSVHYEDGTFQYLFGDSFKEKSEAIFDEAVGSDSVVDQLCHQGPSLFALPVNCTLGMAVGGWSQGAHIAALAGNYAPTYVTAALLYGNGDDGTWVDPCVSDSEIDLPKERRRSIVGESDNYYGGSFAGVQEQQISTSGYSCAARGEYQYDCLHRLPGGCAYGAGEQMCLDPASANFGRYYSLACPACSGGGVDADAACGGLQSGACPTDLGGYYIIPGKEHDFMDITSDSSEFLDESTLWGLPVNFNWLARMAYVGPTTMTTTTPPTGTTSAPTKSPTTSPTKDPTVGPTASPTKDPTPPPTSSPSKDPSAGPTATSTKSPTAGPTAAPSKGPTTGPTITATKGTTAGPTATPEVPTAGPTPAPSESPSAGPSATPSKGPTAGPTPAPSKSPTAGPSATPSKGPTAGPTPAPSESPSAGPTLSPSKDPTAAPTPAPSKSPTAGPTPAITLAPAPASWEEISFDDFATGTWGSPNWEGGGNDAALIKNAKNSYGSSDSYALRIQDNTESSTVTKEIDTTLYITIKVVFQYKPKRMAGSSEEFYFAISTDGGTSFVKIKTWSTKLGNMVNNEWNKGTVEDIDVTGIDSLRIRFVCVGNTNKDRIFLDDIKVEGK